jgi:hypothetical protein
MAASTIAGFLLVASPLLGAIPIANPALIRIWSAPREVYLASIGAHRAAWWWLNAGFSLATIGTACGLAVLAGADPLPAPHGPLLVSVAAAYGLAGTPWLAMLAIRAARDPLLADLAAAGRPTDPAETLLGALTRGLFAAFVFATGLALVALALVLGAGGVAVPVAVLSGAVAAAVLAIQARTGDCIPAILYVPTLLIGIALLAGWS